LNPPSIRLPTSEDIHNAFVCGEEAVTELFISVIDTVKMLLIRIGQPEGQLAKNSTDSSKPPSGDGLKKKLGTYSLRKPGGKSAGGQPGHKGHRPEMADTPDHIVVRTVRTCRNCHASLEKATVTGHDRRQVSDIPPIRPEITGHRIGILRCPQCGYHNKAEFPEEVSQPTQYGSRVKSHAVYFNVYHHIPLKRTSLISEHIFNHRISEAVITEAYEICASEVAPVNEHIRKQLIMSDVVNSDETGICVNKKLHRLTVASPPELTYYHIHSKRGGQGLNDTGNFTVSESMTIGKHISDTPADTDSVMPTI